MKAATHVQCCILLLFIGPSVSRGDIDVIDLTYDFANDTTIYWPTSQSFELFVRVKGLTEKGFWYESNDLLASEHGGTHIDAPVHFSKGKWTVDQIPLKNLIAKAVVVDISSKAESNPDAQLTTDDLMNWEKTEGRIPDRSIVLMNSGWGRHWNNRTAYLGTSTKNTSLLHFPGVHPKAAEWLVANRNIVGVGVDTPSVDFGQSKLFETHVTLFGANIFGLENVANVEKVPTKGAVLHVNPMKIKGGSGAPARLLAVIDDDAISGVDRPLANLISITLQILVIMHLHTLFYLF